MLLHVLSKGEPTSALAFEVTFSGSKGRPSNDDCMAKHKISHDASIIKMIHLAAVLGAQVLQHFIHAHPYSELENVAEGNQCCRSTHIYQIFTRITCQWWVGASLCSEDLTMAFGNS